MLTSSRPRYRPELVPLNHLNRLNRLNRLRALTGAHARDLVWFAARRLDAVHPTWWQHVDRDTLDLSDPRCCLLAQVFGSYELGLYRVYGTHLGSVEEGAAFTGRVSELLWFAEVDRRDREYECVSA